MIPRSARRGAITLIAAFTALVLLASGAFAAKPSRPKPTPTTPAATTLVLYDTSGAFGHLGELYAMQTANLVSHFGTWKAEPVSAYTAGKMSAYKAVVYIGSTYDEPLPQAFLDDVIGGQTPVLWMYDNIWHLGARAGFAEKYGWTPSTFDTSEVLKVRYKGQELTRHPANAGGIMTYGLFDSTRVTTVAEAVRTDGTSFPWAVRSQNLTYIGELPFAYMTERDRYLIFSDMLFDLLAPQTTERHRALVRLEDVGPDADPNALRAIADYLHSEGVPFSVATYTVYKDPKGFYNGGVPEEIRLRDRPDVVDALKYMVSKGGTLLMHGYTHQYGDAGNPLINNPYNGVSGDDFEFFTAHVDEQNYVRYDGPVPEDSTRWALDRVDAATREYKAVGLGTPTIFEFPHYAGSAVDYKAIGSRFSTRYERGLYFGGVLSGAPVDHSRMVGQFFPYVVTDVYGTKVLPENMGDYSPQEYNNHPARFPADLVENARANLVVRDGFASFFFHPFLATQEGNVESLRQIVEGVKSLGYTFVPATSL